MRQRKKIKVRKKNLLITTATSIPTTFCSARRIPVSLLPKWIPSTISPGGPYIQTFSFQNTSLMIGILHHEKTSESMASSLDLLEDILADDFFKLFSLILTDRGPEFEKVSLFETDPLTGKTKSEYLLL